MNQDIKELLTKYRNGSISEIEMALLETWYLKWTPADQEISLARLDELENEVYGLLPKPKQPVKLWPKIAVAAAAIAFVVFGTYFFKAPRHSGEGRNPGSAQYATDIAPGIQGATLTLANGKKIKLSDAVNGELAKEAGVRISKSADGRLVYEITGNTDAATDKINMLSTTNGETYQIKLPDGSMVWLNAASSLKYPASFAKLKNRRVELSGEGYFEVAKDKSHPFIVETAEQEVEVLGTHFNINSYSDESSVKTTLLEGSVRVAYKPRHAPGTRHPDINGRHPEFISGSRTRETAIQGNSKSVLQGRDPDLRQDDDRFSQAITLKPNQQSILSGNNIKVSTIDPEEAIAWKKGDFVFADEDFRTTMRRVARWYDLEIIYDESVPVNIELAGWVSRSSNLSTVLKRIELASKLHFTIEGRRVTVRK